MGLFELGDKLFGEKKYSGDVIVFREQGVQQLKLYAVKINFDAGNNFYTGAIDFDSAQRFYALCQQAIQKKIRVINVPHSGGQCISFVVDKIVSIQLTEVESEPIEAKK